MVPVSFEGNLALICAHACVHVRGNADLFHEGHPDSMWEVLFGQDAIHLLGGPLHGEPGTRIFALKKGALGPRVSCHSMDTDHPLGLLIS